MRVTAALILLTLTASVMAEQYWIEYDPSAGLFPEEVGWTRITHDGGALRYFEDGALVINDPPGTQVVDISEWYRPGALDPAQGERFIAQWQVRIDEVLGYSNPAVAVYSDDGWQVVLVFSEEAVMSLCEPGASAPVEPGIFHQFQLQSDDMRSYQLLMDGQQVLAGSFQPGVSVSLVGWGAGAQGGAGLSRWGWFCFGVVPEPSGLVLLASTGLLVFVVRARRRHAA